MSKLGIGTVQFGLNYGIANQTGKIKLSDAINIAFKMLKYSKLNLFYDLFRQRRFKYFSSRTQCDS